MSSAPAATARTPSRVTVPTRQRRKQARPQELLDAALALFAEKGFAAAKSEQVAARAGVSKGTLYLYYPSKQELFKAVVRQNLSSLIAEGTEKAACFEGSTGELLLQLLVTWWQRVGSTSAASIHKIVLSEVHNFPELASFYNDEVLRPAAALFSGAVRRGVARGEFRAVNEHEAAHALMAPVLFMSLCQQSFGSLNVCGENLEPQALLRTNLDLLLRGLQVRLPEHALQPAAAAVTAPAVPDKPVRHPRR